MTFQFLDERKVHILSFDDQVSSYLSTVELSWQLPILQASYLID